MSEPTDDRKLLLAYHRDGSHEAFGQLVGKYSPMVFQTAVRRTRDHQLAEDVTQAVFIVLARRAGTVKSHESIAGWLHQTAIFASCSALRSQAQQRKRERVAAKPETIVPPSRDESTERIARIEEELHRLPAMHRNVLVLHYLEGKTMPETAERLGVSHETARKRLSRAVERLRKRLARRGMIVENTGIAGAIGAVAISDPRVSAAVELLTPTAGGENGFSFSLADEFIRSLKFGMFAKSVAVAAMIAISSGVIAIATAQTSLPPVVTSSPAVGPTSAPSWREPFEEAYSLQPGELIRRVRRPFIPQRRDYLNVSGFAPGNTPPSIFLKWNGTKLRQEGGAGSTRLDTVLYVIAGIFPGDLQLPPEILAANLASDWVVCDGLSQADRVSAFSKLIPEVIGEGFSIQPVEELCEAIVVSGKFNYVEIPGIRVERTFQPTIHFFRGDPDAEIRGRMGSSDFPDKILKHLGSMVRRPVIIESAIPWDRTYFWDAHSSARYDRALAPDRATVEEILANVAKQTSLNLKLEERTTTLWRLKRVP